MVLERYRLTSRGPALCVELQQTKPALRFLAVAVGLCAIWQFAAVGAGTGHWTDPIGLVFAALVGGDPSRLVPPDDSHRTIPFEA